jgi:large subunit ribosomal protein L21
LTQGVKLPYPERLLSDLYQLKLSAKNWSRYVYAIVKAGGRQEKVAVGDTVTVDHMAGVAGSTVTFPAVLVVDGATVTTDPKILLGVKVTGEVVDEIKGKKIHILRYKNKTGYRRRQGFRSQNTRVLITAINGMK